MHRRRFLSHTAWTAAGTLAFGAPTPDPDVKRVLVMFKCHLDVGFVDTQAAIIHKYFDVYFPKAIQLAADLRQSGNDHYVWTTGSWLIYEYLEQRSGSQRKQMEDALQKGDIAWHALPFTWQSEMLDQSAVIGAIGFSKSLDKRFGRVTTGAKMTDVPGHSRGLIRPLADSGVTLLDIGVNSASTAPDVPPAFVWRDGPDPSAASIVMLYHRDNYGGVIRIPGSDLAIAVEVRDDNAGPHTPEEIRDIYKDLRAQFPSATIQASSMTDIANAVKPYTANLPVLREEIGDTWIYGVGSDPVKVARYRELLRLRQSWVEKGRIQPGDATDLRFLRRFALAVEHTWGTDTKTWLDFEHYRPNDLAAVLDRPKYKTVTGSWVEKRADIDQAVSDLPATLQAEAKGRLARLHPVRPNAAGLSQSAPSPLETVHFRIAIDPDTGALSHLEKKASKRIWATPAHPLALFSYQTLSKPDYDRFLASYITVQTEWAPKDFGKPGIENFGARSQSWTAHLKSYHSGRSNAATRIVTHLEFTGDPETLAITGWPHEAYVEWILPDSEPLIHCHLTWFGKRSNRLPEALWFSFQPETPTPASWSMTKMGQSISPFEVVSRGNRHMHALSTGMLYRDPAGGSLAIETLDAPLVVLGERSPVYFSNAQPDLAAGIHFNLFNNGWGTNYVQWFGEDMLFRFVLKAS